MHFSRILNTFLTLSECYYLHWHDESRLCAKYNFIALRLFLHHSITRIVFCRSHLPHLRLFNPIYSTCKSTRCSALSRVWPEIAQRYCILQYLQLHQRWNGEYGNCSKTKRLNVTGLLSFLLELEKESISSKELRKLSTLYPFKFSF